MITGLEIVDTAIKVSLGALVSGFSTYFVTIRNHSYDIQKMLLSEKKDMLKEAAIKIERGGSLVNNANDAIYDIAVGKDTQDQKEKKFLEAMKLYTAALNSAKEARSLFYMIGLMALAGLAEKYFYNIEQEAKYFDEKQLGYDVEVIDKLGVEGAAIKTQILEGLSKAFDSIYAGK